MCLMYLLMVAYILIIFCCPWLLLHCTSCCILLLLHFSCFLCLLFYCCSTLVFVCYNYWLWFCLCWVLFEFNFFVWLCMVDFVTALPFHCWWNVRVHDGVMWLSWHAVHLSCWCCDCLKTVYSCVYTKKWIAVLYVISIFFFIFWLMCDSFCYCSLLFCVCSTVCVLAVITILQLCFCHDCRVHCCGMAVVVVMSVALSWSVYLCC